MRIYEELFIVKPDAPEEEVDAFVEQMKNVITTQGGTVDKVDKWGMRKLAYRVLKYNEGQYILVQFTAKPETVQEVERRLRVTDVVMKFITVRIDEKLKKIEKRKKEREKRAARQARAAAAAPATPAVARRCPRTAGPDAGRAGRSSSGAAAGSGRASRSKRQKDKGE